MVKGFRPLSGMRCLNRLKNEKEVMELLGLKFPSPLGDEVLKPPAKGSTNTTSRSSFRPLSGMRCLNLRKLGECDD